MNGSFPLGFTSPNSTLASASPPNGPVSYAVTTARALSTTSRTMRGRLWKSVMTTGFPVASIARARRIWPSGSARSSMLPGVSVLGNSASATITTSA